MQISKYFNIYNPLIKVTLEISKPFFAYPWIGEHLSFVDIVCAFVCLCVCVFVRVCVCV